MDGCEQRAVASGPVGAVLGSRRACVTAQGRGTPQYLQPMLEMDGRLE